MIFSVKSILAKIISRQISSNVYGFRPMTGLLANLGSVLNDNKAWYCDRLSDTYRL